MKTQIYGLVPFKSLEKEQKHIVAKFTGSNKMHVYNLSTGESVCKKVKSRLESELYKAKCSSTYDKWSMAEMVAGMSKSTKAATCPHCIRWAEKTYNQKYFKNVIREGIKDIDYIEGD